MHQNAGELQLYNSYTREKQVFKPLHPGFVGVYVCGPTVYNEVHLGNCRTFTSFDLVYRYLLHLGYRVRYVRNITDVGHLQDDGEDRMLKGAKAERLEPMEVAQKYTNGFRNMMRILNNLPPSIEPTATGHIIEQIEMVQRIMEQGFAYERNGSVYLDVPRLIAERLPEYGKLSGKVLDDLLAETRELKNQDDKRHPSDFALWIKAAPEHIMRWTSPWSVGFPGWHLECSAMSTKYLGEQFDLHGGGMDLQFPHHDNEIAQNAAACACHPARYWMHANMLLLNGRKMSKSEGNFILPAELFAGSNPILPRAYSPMTLRFLFLQTHYRSTLDLTAAGLDAAEKGYKRLMEGFAALNALQGKGYAAQDGQDDEDIRQAVQGAYAAMNDDFNTPMALAHWFALVSKVFSLRDGHISLERVRKETLEQALGAMRVFLFDLFGLLDETAAGSGDQTDVVGGLMELIIDIRQQARQNKDWATGDKIRTALQALGIQLKDGKESVVWTKS